MRETIRLWIRQAVQWAWAHPKLALWGGLSGILYFLLRGTAENIFFDGIKWLLYTSFGWLIEVGDVIAIAWFISTVVLPIGLAGLIIYGAYLLGRQFESPARRDLPNAAPAPDMTIWQAIHYLAMKSQWSYEPRGQAESHSLLDDALRACSITAWGQRCLTPIESMREAVSKEPPAIQLSGHEERIPCAEWAHMKIAPCWIGYAEFPQDEYPSARIPHLTFPRANKWVHCYGHLRVSSEEIKRRWPPRLVATWKADATAPTYWTASEAITWIAFGRAITQEESKQTAIDEFLNDQPEEEKVALNSAEAELFERLRSQSMKALGKEGNSEKYSDIPHTVFLSKVGINILHNTIGMDWGADLATRERWDLPDWRDVKVWRSDVLRFWPQPGTTPYEEFVPLPEAARIAFEETGAVDAVMRTGTPEERLAYHANAIIDDDLRDALLAIYGVRPPGRKRRRVPKKELKYSLSNDLSAIADASRGWEGLCVRRTHLNAHIARWKKMADEMRAAEKERNNEPERRP